MIVDRQYIFTLYQMGVGAIYNYLQQIEQRVEDAEARVSCSQQSQVERLSKELSSTKRTLARKSQALIMERQLNGQLLRRIRELERELEHSTLSIERDSHNSSLPPSLDLPWQKPKRTRSLRQKSELKVGGQLGHRGATLRQVAKPHEIIIHTPAACAQCGSHLQHSTPSTSARRQVFDISEGRMRVTEHRAEARRCQACLTTTKARFPASVRAPVQYGMGVLSRVVYLHLYQLLPVARTKETMTDLFECYISVATIQRAARVSSGKLVKTEQRIKAVIRDSSVIGVDETGLRVAGSGGYIHVARTAELTHYGFDVRRGKAAMDEIGILPQFTGTLVRDGWASYQWYEQCRHSLCNAHLLRELVFIEEVDSTQKVWTTPLSKLLVQIKGAAAQARADGAPQLSHQQQGSWLERYQQLLRKAEKLNPLPSPGKDADVEKKKGRDRKPFPNNLIKRLQRRRDEVLRFMTDLSVPFDNNGSERDLRMIKLQQKISGCFRTADGARNFCRVRSYLSTARKQGHSLLHSLERVLNGKPLVFQPAES
ncbi:MAG TPA: IS66 family transposase [Pyrinomonadaceae bacterium]|jgi:transposase|nr:IS66 family transposase [Pyrinomonadaceae bacterium]